MDRDFDRWSPYNESYYREMSYAIYSENKDLLTKVLNKYKIGFILIDRNVINPGNAPAGLYFNQSRKLIEQTGLVTKELSFGNIELFKLKEQANLAAVNTNLNINPKTTTTYQDFAYNTDYITVQNIPGLNNIFMPFRDLIDNQSRLHSNIVNIENDRITLNSAQKISGLDMAMLVKNLNIIPSDLVVQKNSNNIEISLYPNAPVLDNTPLASPIKAVMDTKGENNLLLSFNNNESFSLNGLSENTPVVLGRVLLVNGQNNISLFDSSKTQTITNAGQTINPLFLPCNSGETPPTIGLSKDRIDITAKKDTCIIIPYSFLNNFIKTPDSNILTTFGFNLNGNVKVSSCILDLQKSACVNYPNFVKRGQNFEITYNVSSNSLNSLGIKIVLQNPNMSENKYSLTDLSSSYSESLSDLSLPQSAIAGIFTDKNNLSFSKIYLSRSTSYSLDLNSTETKSLTNICPVNGSDARKEVLSQDNRLALKYTSDNGSFCDGFSFPDVPHGQGYLVAIESENVAGLPLNMCLSDQTSQKCDIYTKLSLFKGFDTDVFLLPPMDESGTGYAVNVENVGVKGTPAINYISSIQFIPIPYNFLENIQSVAKTDDAEIFGGKIQNITEYNPTFFLVTTNSQPTILSLNESFENGFKAYKISCSSSFSCFIKSNLAPFYAKPLQQVLVNNWQNGWIVGAGDSQVVIIFLPQLLEYFGLVLIIIVFGLIVYKLKLGK